MRSHSSAAERTRQDTSRKTPFSIRHYKHLLREGDDGNWFKFRRDYYAFMPKLDALFLQDLRNRAQVAASKKRMREDGYFRCPARALKDWIGREQEHRIASLKKLGFIKTIRAGPSGTRWIFIDLDRLNAEVDRVVEERIEKAQNVGTQSHT